jgi:hypothetical protein
MVKIYQLVFLLVYVQVLGSHGNERILIGKAMIDFFTVNKSVTLTWVTFLFYLDLKDQL